MGKRYRSSSDEDGDYDSSDLDYDPNDTNRQSSSSSNRKKKESMKATRSSSRKHYNKDEENKPSRGTTQDVGREQSKPFDEKSFNEESNYDEAIRRSTSNDIGFRRPRQAQKRFQVEFHEQKNELESIVNQRSHKKKEEKRLRQKPSGYVDQIETVHTAGTDEPMTRVAETDADIEKDLAERPACVVVGILNLEKPNSRIVIVDKYRATIPDGCIEANKAQVDGSFSRENADHHRPSIPSRKFTNEDDTKNTDAEYSVQRVFQIKTNSSNLIVLYVGWDCTAFGIDPITTLETTAPKILEELNIRQKFLRALIAKDIGVRIDEMNRAIERELYMDDMCQKDPNHIFWLYEDIAFFHSKIHLNFRLGQIFYFCLRDKMVDPPNFAYSTTNVLEKKAYKICKKNHKKTMKKWEEFEKSYKEGLVELDEIDTKTSCENPEQCVCNRKHVAVYKSPEKYTVTRKLYKPDSEGYFDLDKYDPASQSIIIECSDLCGCSINCPRRRLQRGQKKPLAVFYENEIVKFGLRAMVDIRSGEIIGEYVGNMIVCPDDDYDGSDEDESEDDPEEDPEGKVVVENQKTRSTVYDAEFNIFDRRLVISSWKVGNITRFAAHACSPSAVIMEMDSNPFSQDVLIPKIVMIARKNIAAGEKITIRYYGEKILNGKEGFPCKCTENCPSHLV